MISERDVGTLRILYDQVVTLVFTTSPNWLSRAIRFLTRSTVSHVAIGTEIFGVPVLIHSALDDVKSGVQVTTRAKWLRSNRLVAEHRLVPDASANLSKMVELLGEKYDRLGLIGYVLVIAAHWFGRVIRNPLASPTALVCPRYVLQLDPDGMLVPEWRGLDPARTTPNDLLQICSTSASFVPVPG